MLLIGKVLLVGAFFFGFLVFIRAGAMAVENFPTGYGNRK